MGRASKQRPTTAPPKRVGPLRQGRLPFGGEVPAPAEMPERVCSAEELRNWRAFVPAVPRHVEERRIPPPRGRRCDPVAAYRIRQIVEQVKAITETHGVCELRRMPEGDS
jgi:hypothetical protein